MIHFVVFTETSWYREHFHNWRAVKMGRQDMDMDNSTYGNFLAAAQGDRGNLLPDVKHQEQPHHQSWELAAHIQRARNDCNETVLGLPYPNDGKYD